MDKKNRTGLQSKISNIFAGVPMPKKKNAESEHPEPDKKDETSEVILPEFVKEKLPDEHQVVIDDLDDDVTDVSFVHDVQDEKSDSLSKDNQSELIGNTLEEPLVEYSTDRESDDDLSGEQFTVVSDSATDFSGEVSIVDEQVDAPQKQNNEVKTSSNESKSIESDRANILDNILAQKSPSKEKESPVQKQPINETVSDKLSPSKEIPSSPVNKPIVEKTVKPLDLKPVQDKQAVKKPDINKIQGFKTKIESKNTAKKTYSRGAIKKLKSPKKQEQPKQKAMVVFAIILAIAFVGILGAQYNLFNFGSESSSGNGQAPGTTPVIRNAASEVKINWQQPPVYPEDIRDPMKLTPGSVQTNSVSKDRFIVKGISYMGERWQVLIGIDLYVLGDTIKGYDAKIIAITKDNVEFENSEGEKWFQEVGQ